MTTVKPDKATLETILRRGVSEVIVEADFVELLQSGKPLRLKQGFDPSAPDIHLGHVVGLRKLRQLQDLGHTVVLIVGDWTARIGDPSGRSATRPMLSAEQVAAAPEEGVVRGEAELGEPAQRSADTGLEALLAGCWGG